MREGIVGSVATSSEAAHTDKAEAFDRFDEVEVREDAKLKESE